METGHMLAEPAPPRSGPRPSTRPTARPSRWPRRSQSASTAWPAASPRRGRAARARRGLARRTRARGRAAPRAPCPSPPPRGPRAAWREGEVARDDARRAPCARARATCSRTTRSCSRAARGRTRRSTPPRRPAAARRLERADGRLWRAARRARRARGRVVVAVAVLRRPRARRERARTEAGDGGLYSWDRMPLLTWSEAGYKALAASGSNRYFYVVPHVDGGLAGVKVGFHRQGALLETDDFRLSAAGRAALAKLPHDRKALVGACDGGVDAHAPPRAARSCADAAAARPERPSCTCAASTRTRPTSR